MRMFALNGATIAAVEAEQDSPEYPDMDSLAAPQVRAVATMATLSDAIEATKREIMAEYIDDQENPPEDEIIERWLDAMTGPLDGMTWAVSPPPFHTDDIEGHYDVSPDNTWFRVKLDSGRTYGRWFQVHSLMTDEGYEVARIVVQMVEGDPKNPWE